MRHIREKIYRKLDVIFSVRDWGIRHLETIKNPYEWVFPYPIETRRRKPRAEERAMEERHRREEEIEMELFEREEELERLEKEKEETK